MQIPIEVFTKLNLFVCTYVAKLGNININFEELTYILMKNLSGNVLAINSNYGHAAQKGYEHFIKSPKTKTKNNTQIKNRTRKMQGDGTCFNSAIEPIIKLNDNKCYFIKCFPTTGETQIPGVIEQDNSDGHKVLLMFIDYLNKLKLGTVENDIVKDIYIINEGPKMLNYKFRLNIVHDRILINLINLTEYLMVLKNNIKDTDWNIVSLPFIIREIKSPVNDTKVSFKFQTTSSRTALIILFYRGRINILGAESYNSAQSIYDFLTQIFKLNWDRLIGLKPLKDCQIE